MTVQAPALFRRSFHARWNNSRPRSSASRSRSRRRFNRRIVPHQQRVDPAQRARQLLLDDRSHHVDIAGRFVGGDRASNSSYSVDRYKPIGSFSNAAVM